MKFRNWRENYHLRISTPMPNRIAATESGWRSYGGNIKNKVRVRMEQMETGRRLFSRSGSGEDILNNVV